ncbi:hypothetical protein E2320_020513, partial [Naja naja]
MSPQQNRKQLLLGICQEAKVSEAEFLLAKDGLRISNDHSAQCLLCGPKVPGTISGIPKEPSDLEWLWCNFQRASDPDRLWVEHQDIHFNSGWGAVLFGGTFSFKLPALACDSLWEIQQ